MSIHNIDLTVKAIVKSLMDFRGSHCLRGKYPFEFELLQEKHCKSWEADASSGCCILFSSKDMKNSVTFLAITHFHTQERT